MLIDYRNITVAILTFLLILPVSGYSKLPDLQVPAELIFRKTQSHDPSLYVFAKDVMSSLAAEENMTLVDVRPKSSFAKSHIPGSIHLPLYFIETRQFLKNRNIVLIDQGYTAGLLEKDCRDLRKKGYMVSILYGGINSWYQNRGPVEGKDPFFKASLNKISAHEFFKGKDFKNQLIIDVSKEQLNVSKEIIPYSIFIPFSKNNRSFLNKITEEIHKKNGDVSPVVLIYNTQGNHYPQIEKIISDNGLQNVFFLKDGILGYRKYLQSLSRSFEPKENRIHRSSNGCGSCNNQ